MCVCMYCTCIAHFSWCVDVYLCTVCIQLVWIQRKIHCLLFMRIHMVMLEGLISSDKGWCDSKRVKHDYDCLIPPDGLIESIWNCLIRWLRNINNIWHHTREKCCPNVDRIFLVFPRLYVYTRLYTACLYILATLHFLESLFRQVFVIPLLCVYMNLHSIVSFSKCCDGSSKQDAGQL